MVDISKIRVGDMITVYVMVIALDGNDPQHPLAISDWPSPDQIVGHTPAQLIVVGSRVKSRSGYLFIVAALSEKEAWLRDSEGYHSTYRIFDLVLADEEPS